MKLVVFLEQTPVRLKVEVKIQHFQIVLVYDKSSRVQTRGRWGETDAMMNCIPAIYVKAKDKCGREYSRHMEVE